MHMQNASVQLFVTPQKFKWEVCNSLASAVSNLPVSGGSTTCAVHLPRSRTLRHAGSCIALHHTSSIEISSAARENHASPAATDKHCERRGNRRHVERWELQPERARISKRLQTEAKVRPSQKP